MFTKHCLESRFGFGCRHDLSVLITRRPAEGQMKRTNLMPPADYGLLITLLLTFAIAHL